MQAHHPITQKTAVIIENFVKLTSLNHDMSVLPWYLQEYVLITWTCYIHWTITS